MYGFSRSVSGITRNFEIVPSAISGSEEIYEPTPVPGSGFSYCYRTDGAGDTSPNTGFFCLFKQGSLEQQDFTISESVTNLVKPIDSANINNPCRL